MKSLSVLLIFLLFPFMNTNAQSVPSVEEVHNFFSNQNILVTYREGGAVYGTYYFLEIHYCPQGYGLYGYSEKQTVMGNRQKNNWQEFGTWKATEQNGLVGLFYTVQSTGMQNFVPIYKLADGSLTIGQGYSIVKQGAAICN